MWTKGIVSLCELLQELNTVSIYYVDDWLLKSSRSDYERNYKRSKKSTCSSIYSFCSLTHFIYSFSSFLKH